MNEITSFYDSHLKNYEFYPSIINSNTKILQKFSAKYLITYEKSLEIYEEYIKFMMIYSSKLKISSDVILFPSTMINNFWKYHILCTTSYSNFCQQLGLNLIYYNPMNFEIISENQEELKKCYENTKKQIIEIFKCELNQEIWPEFSVLLEKEKYLCNINMALLKKIVNGEKRENNVENIQNYENFQLKNKRENFCPDFNNFYYNITFDRNFKMFIIKKLMINENKAEKLIIEYGKLLYLFKICDFAVVPSGLIDEIWHLHMLFIKNYNECCMKIKGEIFKHTPSIEENTEHKTELKSSYSRTIKKLDEIFGERDEFLWPSPESHDFKSIFLEHRFKCIDLKEFKIGKNDFSNYFKEELDYECIIYCARKNEDNLL